MRARSAAVLAALFGPNGLEREELLILLGLGLLTRGVWLAWPPAAYIVSGLIILWIALPTRAAFVVRDAPDPGQSAPPPRRTG